MDKVDQEISDYQKKREEDLVPYKKLITRLKKDEAGYMEYRVIPGRGLCAIAKFAFTVGLVVGIEKDSYYKRYCYPMPHGPMSAFMDLLTWNGKGDPSGPWVKCKGRDGEYGNPNY